jgi:hypothetical protein
MNVLHSRRKRERERIEIEVLHEQADDYRSQNSELKRENDRLEVLLVSAQHQIDHQARHPQQESSSFPFLNPKRTLTAEGSSFVAHRQPPTAQVDQSVTCGLPTAPQGQFILTAASGVPYCLMPSAVLSENGHPLSFPMQHASFLPQQHVLPLVNFHYPTSAPFLMPMPLSCQSTITRPQNPGCRLPMVTAPETYNQLGSSADGRIDGDHIDEA